MPRRPRASVQVLDIDPEHMIEWEDTNVNPEIKEPCTNKQKESIVNKKMKKLNVVYV